MSVSLTTSWKMERPRHELAAWALCMLESACLRRARAGKTSGYEPRPEMTSTCARSRQLVGVLAALDEEF
jgi:hypothetical protein